MYTDSIRCLCYWSVMYLYTIKYYELDALWQHSYHIQQAIKAHFYARHFGNLLMTITAKVFYLNHYTWEEAVSNLGSLKCPKGKASGPKSGRVLSCWRAEGCEEERDCYKTPQREKELAQEIMFLARHNVH